MGNAAFALSKRGWSLWVTPEGYPQIHARGISTALKVRGSQLVKTSHQKQSTGMQLFSAHRKGSRHDRGCERFSLKYNSTGSDALVRIGDAISRILANRYGDAVRRIGVAQMRIGVALTAK